MITSLSSKYVVLAALVIIAIGSRAEDKTTPLMKLVVDETQAARQIAFVHEEIRVQPGPLSLAYPRWIPGEHGPTGPIEQLAVIKVLSGNTILPWTRDSGDINIIHVDIPSGTSHISVDFDTLLENTISSHQLLLAWNTTILYPLHVDKRDLMIEPSIILPSNWKQGSSLHVTGQSGNRVNFAPLSLERLIDSPVLAGDFFRAVPLKSDWPAELDIAGDSQAAIDKADDAHAFELFGKLIDQDRAMFGFHHWQTMHILISQSDARPFDGLEHEDSPYNAMPDEALSKKEDLERLGWPLLAHEQSHSWCGKYRRPAELYSKPNYQGPERTSLLWVYEGLNEYIGMLLATRAGFDDQPYMRDYIGRTTANFAQEPARATTPLVDTATENWVLRTVSGGWGSLRRSQDYYDEGALIWLRADTIIREQSHDRLSLDDFLRSFFGQRDTGPIVVPYTREEVEASLNATLPYDWHAFFETHIYQPNPKPPTDGLEAAGWRLVYNDTPNNKPFYSDPENPITFSGWYSIGIGVRKDGMISDVVPGTPAYEAGLGPHMKIISVDGRVFSGDVLTDAVAHPQSGKISMVVKNFDSVASYEIHYAGGLRYPHLERIPNTHDYLTEILEIQNSQLH